MPRRCLGLVFPSPLCMVLQLCPLPSASIWMYLHEG